MVVDDSSSIDGEIFNLEEFEGADWVIISDEVPVEDSRRDELLEDFQAEYVGGDPRQRGSEAVDGDEDDDVDDEPHAPHSRSKRAKTSTRGPGP